MKTKTRYFLAIYLIKDNSYFSTRAETSTFTLQAFAKLPGGGEYKRGIMDMEKFNNLLPENLRVVRNHDAYITLPNWFLQLLLERIQSDWEEWNIYLDEERILC